MLYSASLFTARVIPTISCSRTSSSPVRRFCSPFWGNFSLLMVRNLILKVLVVKVCSFFLVFQKSFAWRWWVVMPGQQKSKATWGIMNSMSCSLWELSELLFIAAFGTRRKASGLPCMVLHVVCLSERRWIIKKHAWGRIHSPRTEAGQGGQHERCFCWGKNGYSGLKTAAKDECVTLAVILGEESCPIILPDVSLCKKACKKACPEACLWMFPQITAF